MLPFLTERFANPSGSHRFARDARRAVDEARDDVAAAIGCRPGEVVFTGCGTEADNAAIVGAVRRHGGRARVPVRGAPRRAAHRRAPRRHGGARRRVPAACELDALADALADDVAVVSVMAVNNEVGTVTDLAPVAARRPRAGAGRAACTPTPCRRRAGSTCATLWPHVDLLSLSAHKFGGPKGVGVLAVREGAAVDALIVGGGQERDRRSGTHNVAGIVALATALDGHRCRAAAPRCRASRPCAIVSSPGSSPACRASARRSPPPTRSPARPTSSSRAIESEALLYLLDEAGVCASAASACASGAMDPSHVLAAMGVDRSWAAGALRLTLGRTTTDADVDDAVTAIVAAVATLRRRTAARA